VKLSLQTNAMYKYTHRRLMGQAKADPARPDPAAQRHECPVYQAVETLSVEDVLKARLLTDAAVDAHSGLIGALRRVAGRMKRRLLG
jgi:hypothetical protein